MTCNYCLLNPFRHDKLILLIIELKTIAYLRFCCVGYENNQ